MGVGHPLEHGEPTTGHILKENIMIKLMNPYEVPCYSKDMQVLSNNIIIES